MSTPTNMGPGYARNLGIKSSKGEILAFLDSGDTYMANYLERCVSIHYSYPSHPIISFSFTHTNAPNKKNPPISMLSIPKLVFRPAFCTPCTSIKRTMLRDMFPVKYHSEDFDFFITNLIVNNNAQLIKLSEKLVMLDRKPGSVGGLSSQRLLMLFGFRRSVLSVLFRFCSEHRPPLATLLIVPAVLIKIELQIISVRIRSSLQCHSI